MTIIRTVLGDIAPPKLGVTYPHEHLISVPPEDVTDPDLALPSEAAAAAELGYFKQAGGQALVEMSTRAYGRSPLAMQRLSSATGVHIIATTGWIKEKFFRRYVEGRTVEDIAGEMIRDVTEGMDGTDARAGVIKAGSSKNEITDLEACVLEAAALAHRETGAPISTHTEAGTMALEQIDLLTAGGVAPDRMLIGHMDRKLDWDYHLEVAKRGVGMGFDQFSKEKYYPDSQRIDFIVRLIDAGYGDQIFVSGDMARQSYLTAYGGGPGFTFILWRIVPWMRECGIPQEMIHQIMVKNPQRLFQFEANA